LIKIGKSMTQDILPGQSYPLGSSPHSVGVNFCIFSKNAEAMELLLFEEANASKPSRVIQLDRTKNKTFHYWHIFVKGLKAGQIYAYRAYGPFAPEKGYRFDGSKILLDPYAKAIVGEENYDRYAASITGDNCAKALKAVVVDSRGYDWEGDKPLRIPYSQSVIYELHVGGFTSHPNSGVSPEKKGTYAGLIEKIPYLKELGITAVELLPIHQFDEQHAPSGRKNYWGYSTVSFFAPHRSYSSRRDPLGPVEEFRDMVKALHLAGIEVILDVVFNHTAEGDHTGPTLSFRGLENHDYYILDRDNPAHYSNYSGCGNTINANHQVVGPMIIECLRYWVGQMHVDGFRFDLASVLSRDQKGEPMENPPILWLIDADPLLAGTKLIAEAWDAEGLYQVGEFAGDHFTEWNGKFRDDVRRFVMGGHDTVSSLADRLKGSPDIYPQPTRRPNRSINFVTCHDGFTLNDLVSYNHKHNEANGEDNLDGTNDNFSWNCGIEGETKEPQIESLRLRQIKNLLTILLISEGTPMLLMGDEVRRSQLGNNNAYCQDNEISWFDWSLVDKNADLLRFTKKLIHFVQTTAIFRQQKFLTTTPGSEPYIIWHGVELGEPDWGYSSHCLAFTLHHPEKDEHLHIMLNAYWEELPFKLPPPILPHERWYRIVDTAQPSPKDFSPLDSAPPIQSYTYPLQARSVVVLMARSD
jgi:glycogen operon protein